MAAASRFLTRFEAGPLAGLVSAFRRVLELVPQSPPLGKVIFRPRLVAFVTTLALAALAIAVATVRWTNDAATLAVGAAIIFAMALFTVGSFTKVHTVFSHGSFVHLGMALVLGPMGASAAALSETLGVALRTRNGWFRTVFNLADIFLGDVAAWWLFLQVSGLAPNNVPVAICAGLCAGVAQFIVNHMGVASVVVLASPDIPFVRVARHELGLFPYCLGYGIASFAFVVMHQQAGTLGFVTMLVPVVLLHGFLILLARRVRQHEIETTTHQKEREALLQRAVDASESERRRIARDLHDGVVQNLAGMAYTLMATASQLKEKGAENGDAELLEVLEHSAEETRSAMKDLRTLIIEIAPPTLRREGLHAALLEILNTLKGAGVETKLALPSNMRLRQDRASLIFRVAQEVLRNVAAHAEAKHVSVVLKELHNMAVLEIADDGKGFTPADVARRRAKGHVGTSAIVELAEDAGGSLTIDSKPGIGTRVTLSVPAE